MSDKELMQEALKWQEHIKVLANEYAENELYQKRSKVLDWLIEQAEKAEKYREALEEIKSHQVVGVANWGIEYAKLQKIAHEALEGEQ